MGGNQSSEKQFKPQEKNKPRHTRVITNTPYLKALFQKLAQRSGDGLDVQTNTYTTVSQQVFEDAFNGPLKVFGRLLFCHMNGHSGLEKSACIHLKEFLEVASDVMGLMTSTQQIDYYFDMFSGGQPTINIDGLYHMIQVTVAVSIMVAYLPFDQSPGNDKLMRALAISLMGPNEILSKAEFMNWCHRHTPNIFNGLHCFLLIKLSGTEFDDMSWHQRMSQDLSEASVALLRHLEEATTEVVLTPCVLWLLSASLPNRYVMEQKSTDSKSSIVPNFLISRLQLLTEKNAWSQLYCSNRNGLSVNRFEHHVFAYRGPTVSLFVFENNLYALATDQEWRESSSMWGSERTFLIQLKPRYALVDSGSIIYSNHHMRGVFKGIQIGSNPKDPVIKIADMATVSHRGVQLTLEQVEVWGCANSAIRDIQLKQRAWERKEVEKVNNRKLKLENWQDNPDRMLLDWVGVKTSHHEKV
ncbi:uncharacterized protein [Watersipora subatra]|uniref:uncharacterized protein isoform X2 n=1 Tax=Watersipora subatra TaxID=2589382 RepID=UPI00355B3CC8